MDNFRTIAVCVFYKGHIDDVPRPDAFGRAVIDILNPPWKEWPQEVPMSFDLCEESPCTTD